MWGQQTPPSGVFLGGQQISEVRLWWLLHNSENLLIVIGLTTYLTSEFCIANRTSVGLCERETSLPPRVLGQALPKHPLEARVSGGWGRGGAGGGDSPSDKWAMGWGGGLKGLVLGWGRSWTQGQGQASVWLGEGRPVLGVIPEPASLCLSCQGSHAAPFLRSLTPKHVRAPEAGGGVSVRAP